MRKDAKNKIMKRRVRPRTDNAGDLKRIRKITVRVTARLSNEVASIQGLMFAYGRRETICDVFERVLMPRLREYV